MRKSLHFTAVLLLFLQVPASITWAQTVEFQKGLCTATFNTNFGSLRVYLPEDILPGETISGTIVLEPAGSNERQLQKSIEQLRTYQLVLDGKKIGIPDRRTHFNLVTDQTVRGVLDLSDASGKRVASLTLNLPASNTHRSYPQDCYIPSHALTAAPISIPGNFDGNSENTRCEIAGKPVEVLAESPGQTIIFYPDVSGNQKLEVREQGRPGCSKQVSSVSLNVSAGKLNLLRGERTYVDVDVQGLQGLPDTALLTVTNATPSVVIMEPANLFTTVLFGDSVASGNYHRRFDIQSTRNGSFAINVNLDLPGPFLENTGETVDTITVPPGYIKKDCDCNSTVTLNRNGSGAALTCRATATGSCSGACGIGINTFTRCALDRIDYAWTITEGAAAADITNGASSPEISIRIRDPHARVVIKVKATTVCKGCNSCSSENSMVLQDGDGGDHVPPTVPRDPEHPPTTTTDEGKCACNVTASILRIAFSPWEQSFFAWYSASCKGTSGSGASKRRCNVASVSFAWSITAGGDVVSIKGAANLRTVTLTALKAGHFVLTLTVTTTCSDGTTCSVTTNYEGEVPPPPEQSCVLSWQQKGEPAMDGGLKPKYVVTNKEIKRDDFLALGAEGADYDQLQWSCDPQRDCRDTKSLKSIPLNSRVKFRWEIIEGDGAFVQLGCLTESISAEGDNVIFKPPVVPLPVAHPDTTIRTVIELYIIDDNPTQVQDETRVRTITILTKRNRQDRLRPSNSYFIDVRSESYRLPAAPAAVNPDGTCLASGPQWTRNTDLKQPEIKLPDVPDKNIILLGQWVVLEAIDQRDPDHLRIFCDSRNQCPTVPAEMDLEDNLLWEWNNNAERGATDAGRIITDKTGRFIIYEAPMTLPRGKDKVVITISVSLRNEPGKIADNPRPPNGELQITIYQPGVRMQEVPVAWLPENGNSVSLTSEIMYKDGGWNPGPAHSCRIHFFELMDVSKEPGVCMNDPVIDPRKTEACYDLDLQKEGEQEVFDERTSRDCDRTNVFMQARSLRPVKQFAVTIHSYDYGSYGMIRSFANVNKGGRDSIKGEKPVYISIPWTDATCTHAQRPRRFKNGEFGDNRTSIPLDIDLNHIADNGYSAERIPVPDPLSNAEDDEDQPRGDGFHGDGLSNYEEYRGFMVTIAGTATHIRTDWQRKDIFLHNPDELNHALYDRITGLNVHEVTSSQYNGDDSRIVNRNATRATHIVDQMGLKLVNAGTHPGLLGIACSAFGNRCDPKDANERPAPPNWMREIRVYADKVNEFSTKFGLVQADKLAEVVAHELLHGNNVCHHGEKYVTPDESSTSFNNFHGLRSGDMNCVMRYDNVGRPIDLTANPPVWLNNPRNPPPEPIPGALCTSREGTGYNRPTYHKERKGGVEIDVEDVHPPPGFGNCDTNRGDCSHQFRVSGRGWVRGTVNGAPKSCGNRE